MFIMQDNRHCDVSPNHFGNPCSYDFAGISLYGFSLKLALLVVMDFPSRCSTFLHLSLPRVSNKSLASSYT